VTLLSRTPTCVHAGAPSMQASVISITIRPSSSNSNNDNDETLESQQQQQGQEEEEQEETEDQLSSTLPSASSSPVSTTTTTTALETTTNDEECSLVTVEMTTPQAVKFQLTCNDKQLWNYPPQTNSTRLSVGIYSLSNCIAPTACCELIIQNDGKSTLATTTATTATSSAARKIGRIKVEQDGRSIFSMKTLPNKPFPFGSFTRIFGDSCDANDYNDDDDDNNDNNIVAEKEEEVIARAEDGNNTSSTIIANSTTDLVCTPQQETPLHLAITLDENPQEQSWFLVCTSSEYATPTASRRRLVTLWDTPKGSLTREEHAHTTIQEKACIPNTHKCIFSIHDSEGDGLGTTGGGYSLFFGNQTLGGSYMSQEEFDQVSYCVGHPSYCGALPEYNATDDDDDDNERVEIPARPTALEGSHDPSSEKKDGGVSWMVVVVFIVIVSVLGLVLVKFTCARSSTETVVDKKVRTRGEEDSDKEEDDQTLDVEIEEEYIL